MAWIETPDSSNIARFDYDAATKVLSVQFRSGGVYTYSGVQKRVFTQMKAASSVGKFFEARIKGVYEYSRIG